MKYYVKSRNNEYVSILADNSLWLTFDIDKAFLFKSKDKARNVAKHGVSNKVKRQHGPFTVHAVEEELPAAETPKSIKNNIDSTQDKPKIEIPQIVENFFVEIKNLIDENMSDISDRLSEVDLELSDMLHYIEFHKFSACEGYKLCKKLQQILDRRRVIKNEMKVAQETERIYNPLNIMDKVNHQIYEPRVLNTLFDENKNKVRDNYKK